MSYPTFGLAKPTFGLAKPTFGFAKLIKRTKDFIHSFYFISISNFLFTDATLSNQRTSLISNNTSPTNIVIYHLYSLRNYKPLSARRSHTSNSMVCSGIVVEIAVPDGLRQWIER